MMKRIVILLSLIALVLCGNAYAESAMVDDRGVEIAVDSPERVVCLYGSYAEAWMLAGGTPVGVTEDAVSERNLDLPDDVQIIGTNKEPNLELVIALDPDLVIVSTDISQQLDACSVLEDAGIPCAAFQVDTWQDFADMMLIFTNLTGRNDLYDSLIPPMQAEIEAIIESSSSHPASSVLLLRAYSSGVRAKGADNLAGIMLSDLGCINIADSDSSIMEDLSLEAIVAADPDFIFISVMGGDEATALETVNSTLGVNPAWQALTAVTEGRVYVLPRELFHYKPNSRWSESYAYLAEILFGE